MSYSVLIANKVAAQDIQSFNRSGKCAADLENGMVVVMGSKTGTAGEDEVWTLTQPASGAGLTNLWMVNSPEVVTTISGSNKFKGIDPDPRNFINKAGDIVDVFRLQVGDIFTITADGLSGTKSTNEYVVATASDYQLNWAAAPVSGVSCKLLDTTYISIADGSIGSQRVVSYSFEVVSIA